MAHKVGSKKQVLVVGAGITGCLTAFQLSEKFRDSIRVTVIEKSRGAGGRMATNRHPQNGLLKCDYGAQYLSVTPEFQKRHFRYYEDLQKADVVESFQGIVAGENPFDGPGVQNYVAPNGINSIAKYYLKKSGADVLFGDTCETINFSEDRTQWKVTSKSNEAPKIADSLVITIPAPQILKLGGDISALLDEHKENLGKVEYSSRYSLVMYFDDLKDTIAPWTCRYTPEDATLAFISIDSKKRNKDITNGVSLVAHSNVPFGLNHLDEDFETVEPLIWKSVQKFLPELPEPSYTKCHRWRYSQVWKNYPGAPGCLVIHENPLLILGGDCFIKSNFDNCISGSQAILENFSTFYDTL